MEIKDIENLAKLARIDLNEGEKKSLLRDTEEILKFVAQIGKVSTEMDTEERDEVTKNVVREDKNPHLPSVYSDELLNEAPKSRDGFVEVKKILNNE